MAQTQSTTNVETQSSSNNDATATTSTTDSNKTNQQSQQSPQVLNEPLIFNALPIIAYLSYLVSSGMQLSSIFTASIQTCYRDTIIVIVGYSIGKMLTYLLFVYRIHIVYNESSFQYNVKILIIFAIFIIIYMTATMIILSVTLKVLVMVYTEHDLSGCRAIMLTGVAEISSLFDLVTNSICCYLFIKPLWSLIKMGTEKTRDKKSYFVKNVLLKCVVLTSIAVLSTFSILITVAVSKWGAFLCIDYVINSICLMLLNKKYNRYYKVLCCGTIKCFSRIFYS